MSNRFGRRAQEPPTAQGPQDQYGPAQEGQEQYGPRPPQGTQEQYGPRTPQGTQEQYGRQPAAQEQYVPRPSRGYEDVREREGARAAHEAPPQRGGLQWHGHGGGLLMMTGILAFLEGLAHLLRRAFFTVLPHYAYNWSVTGWGWTHMILGIVLFLAGIVALTGFAVARVVGAIVAAATAVVYFLFIPYSPVWSIVIVALCAACMWTLLAPRSRHI